MKLVFNYKICNFLIDLVWYIMWINYRYEDLRKKVCKIKEKYPHILALIEDDEVNGLNAEKCKNLHKLLSLYSRMMDYEDREIFFHGAKENY